VAFDRLAVGAATHSSLTLAMASVKAELGAGGQQEGAPGGEAAGISTLYHRYSVLFSKQPQVARERNCSPVQCRSVVREKAHPALALATIVTPMLAATA